MKNVLFLFVISFIHFTALSQNYPNIDPSIQFVKSDFTEIDKLLEEGQPNKAISKTLIVQLLAISKGNLVDLEASYERLRKAIPASGKEEDGIQDLLFEQHKVFLKTTGPTRNLAARALYNLLNDWRMTSAFSYDDESLKWNLGDTTILLKNRDFSPLRDFYFGEILKNESDLMRISTKDMYEDVDSKLYPTLFDVLAHERINMEGYKSREDQCSFLPTVQFAQLKMKESGTLQAKLEVLNRQYKRWDAYALCMELRFRICESGGNDAEKEQFFLKIQKEMILEPASNRFALWRAAYFAQQGSIANWKAPSENDNGFVKALEIIDLALKAHPKSDFTVELQDLKKKIEKSSLSFTLDSEGIPTDNQLMRVNYRNLTSAYFVVYKVQSEKKVMNEDNPLRKYNLKKNFDRELTFEQDPKMLSHSKDFILSVLTEPGRYVLIAAPSEEKVKEALSLSIWPEDLQIDMQVLQLSNLVVRHQSDKNGYAILVNDAQTGKPIQNALVKAEPYNKYETGGFSSEGKTDENGLVILPVTGHFRYAVFHQDDSVSSEAYHYSYSEGKAVRQQVFTDRSIYRPGQTVFFKTLSYEDINGNGNTLKGKRVEVIFKDQNHQEIYKSALTTNQFGTTAGSFVLPKKGFPLGEINIYVNGNYLRSVQVEEYKRPTFEVLFDDPKGRVVLGEKFTMTGKVMAYAGYPLTNTEVEIEVSEMRYFPYWCFVLEEWRNYDTTITVTTNEEGVFSFEYRSDKPKDAYAVYYNFEAFVTDISGETQTANHTMYLGKNAYTISTAVKSKYRTDEKGEIQVDVHNSQYELQENVPVQYTLLQEDQSKWYLNEREESQYADFTRKEFEKKFPRTRYYADQNQSFETTTKGEVKSGSKITLAELKPGTYRLDLKTVDEVGDTIRSTENFVVWDPESKKGQHLSEFWVEASNQQPSVGEPVDIFVGSSYKKAHLMTAIYNENGLISIDYTKLRKRKKMTFTVDEANKRGLNIYTSIIANGKVKETSTLLTPIDTSKVLKLKFKSISEPLRPGSGQSWEVEIAQNGEGVKDAELLASMYDASLDAFTNHYWTTNLLSGPVIRGDWQQSYSYALREAQNAWAEEGFYREMLVEEANYLYEAISAPMTGGILELAKIPGAKMIQANAVVGDTKSSPNEEVKSEEAPAKQIRENFNETAFFEPQIHVSPDGTYKWTFTLPDALTRWKMMAFAHTSDFKTVYYSQSFEARKELMLETFEPRFWKKGDELFWVGKVVNLSDKAQTVQVNLKIQNLVDESDVSNLFGDFTTQTLLLQPNESKAVEWPIKIGENCPSLVRFEAEASTAEFADIVRKNMPILEGKERITLAQNFTISKAGTHELELKDIDKVSDEAQVLSYSVSVQTQPLWSTMLSLTHLLEPTNILNESYFAQYFGASLAQKILDDHPSMRQALQAWQAGSEDALTSLLEQNEELKALLLSETPWLLEGTTETQQLRRLGQLLDEDFLYRTKQDAWTKLLEFQLTDGSWSWVGKDRSSWYITQYFAKGMAQLLQAGIEVDSEVMAKALAALDTEYERRFNLMTKKQKEEKQGLGSMEVEWLYIRSVLKASETEASKYYAAILEKQWNKFGLASQSLIGLFALETKNEDLSKKLMASFEDRAQQKKTLGMYWSKNILGYGWYENNIEIQAKLIDFYQRFGGKEQEVKEMQKWLLQQKRSQLWDTPKATAMACFALKDFGQGDAKQEASLQFGNESPKMVSQNNPFDKLRPATQDLSSAKAGAELTTSSDALVFASAQLVYSDKAANIAKTTGDFRVERNYYILEKGVEVEISETRAMEVGDRVRVKIKMVNDRDLDFVYVEDPRASGWEPMDVISGYRYDEAYYYLSVRDSKTEIFIENLRKGTYIFEYDLKVTVKGKLQVGPAKASCYYAPSFSANSEGEVFEIK